jgi:hypothetical protein
MILTSSLMTASNLQNLTYTTGAGLPRAVVAGAAAQDLVVR